MNLTKRLHQTFYAALEGKLDTIWDKVCTLLVSSEFYLDPAAISLQLNVYYYEMYECLLRIKKMLNPNFESVQSNVLLFLGPYKRTM
jgi:hypothetical protein